MIIKNPKVKAACAVVLISVAVVITLDYVGAVPLSETISKYFVYDWLPFWQNGYFAVWKDGLCPSPPCDYFTYYKFYVKTHGSYEKQVELELFDEWPVYCPDLSCINIGAGSLTVIDGVVTYSFDSTPIFMIENNQFCQIITNPLNPGSEFWADEIIEAYGDIKNCKVYDREGKIIFEGTGSTVVKDDKVAVAIVCDGITIGAAFPSSVGAEIRIADRYIDIEDAGCILSHEPIPTATMKAYVAFAPGMYPELANDLYCKAFGGCEPQEFPTWNIDWQMILIIIVLILLLFLIL